MTSAVKKHLFISGTGRAGTSFLVRFLTELGLDTTLSRRGSSAYWDKEAEAGLEEAQNFTGDADLPYVLKSPASPQVLTSAVRSKRISIDAMLIPMRKLSEAAASRSILEMRSLHENQPWRAELEEIIPIHGVVPGGVLYSLHPLDQARLLAVSFHDLLLLAAEAEIPVFLVSFPRLAQDCEYLWRSIRGAVPGCFSEEDVAEAYRRAKATGAPRVGDEFQKQNEKADSSLELLDMLRVDNIALQREIRRLRSKLPNTNS